MSRACLAHNPAMRDMLPVMAYSSDSGPDQLKRISYSPRFMKRLFPLFAIGVLLAALFAAAMSDDVRGASSSFAMFVLVALALFFIRRRIWSLADEVRDGGSFLLVRRGEIEQKVYLHDIEAIDHETAFVPPGIRITCRTPGPLGRKIRFLGDDFESMISTPPIVRDLRERVERLRGAS